MGYWTDSDKLVLIQNEALLPNEILENRTVVVTTIMVRHTTTLHTHMRIRAHAHKETHKHKRDTDTHTPSSALTS